MLTSDAETPFLGKAVRADFLEEAGLGEASRNGWTCDSQSSWEGCRGSSLKSEFMAKSPHQNRSFLGGGKERTGPGGRMGSLVTPFQILCCPEGEPGGTGMGEGACTPREGEKLRPAEEEGVALQPGTRVPNCQLRPRGGAVTLTIVPPLPIPCNISLRS